jgi:hypothetical protein
MLKTYKKHVWNVIENMIEMCKNIFFETTGISNLQNMTQNMIEIETLLSETMLGSCLCIVVLNQNLLE